MPRPAAGGQGPKIKSTIHWVSARHAVDAEVRLYDTLFTVPKPDEAPDFKSVINPQSLEIVRGAKVEPAVAEAAPEDHVQFERVGYFVADWKDHRPDRPGLQPQRGPARHLGPASRRPPAPSRAPRRAVQWKKTPPSMLRTWPVTLSVRQNATT